MAGETRELVLSDIYSSLNDALQNGYTKKQFMKSTTEKLQKSGWLRGIIDYDDDGKPIYDATKETTNKRLERIYRQNLLVAHAAGRYEAFMNSALEFCIVVAILDVATRKHARELNGRVFHKSDPFLANYYPPFDWGCRCEIHGISEREVSSLGKDPDEIRRLAGVDKIRNEDYVNQRTGEITPRKVYDLGNGEVFRAGIGWDYNPTLSFWEQRVLKANFDDDVDYREVLRSAVGGVVTFDAHKPMAAFAASKLITVTPATVAEENELVNDFLKRNGANKKGIVELTDPRGKPVYMSKLTFTDRKTGDLKVMKSGRFKYMNFLPEVIKDPDFITYQQLNKPGRTIYYKAYKKGDEQVCFLVAVDGRNVGQAVSAYNIKASIKDNIMNKLNAFILGQHTDA